MTHRPFRTPALDCWRQELRRGDRTTTRFDPLWQAACAEQWALDLAPYSQVAESFRRDAVKILHDAAARQRRGKPVQ